MKTIKLIAILLLLFEIGNGQNKKDELSKFNSDEQNRKILTKERKKQIFEHTPLNRFGEPDELAGAVIWLASRKKNWRLPFPKRLFLRHRLPGLCRRRLHGTNDLVRIAARGGEAGRLRNGISLGAPNLQGNPIRICRFESIAPAA